MNVVRYSNGKHEHEKGRKGNVDMFQILVWFLPGCCRKMLCWWRHTEAAGLKRKKEKQRIMELEKNTFTKNSQIKKNHIERVNGDDLLGFRTIWWKVTEFEVTDDICQTGIWCCSFINAIYTTCLSTFPSVSLGSHHYCSIICYFSLWVWVVLLVV